jgi:hypothetical protein
MQYRFSTFPRAARIIAVIAAAGVIFFSGTVASNFFQVCPDPAPLGRTDSAVTVALNQALPNGTSVDSADRFLSSLGLVHRVSRSSQPEIRAIERNVKAAFAIKTDIRIELHFDSAGRLVRRDVRTVYTGS